MDLDVGEASSTAPCRVLTKVRACQSPLLRWHQTARASHRRAYKTGARAQIPCRYGLGCTHMADPVHLQRFWHPSLPEQRTANPEDGFVCNECGLVFADVHELQVPSRVPSACCRPFAPLWPPVLMRVCASQLHMRRKTAWSNQSLIGCRVSCLLDNREWQEGSVIQCVAVRSSRRLRANARPVSGSGFVDGKFPEQVPQIGQTLR